MCACVCVCACACLRACVCLRVCAYVRVRVRMRGACMLMRFARVTRRSCLPRCSPPPDRSRVAASPAQPRDVTFPVPGRATSRAPRVHRRTLASVRARIQLELRRVGHVHRAYATLRAVRRLCVGARVHFCTPGETHVQYRVYTL